MLVLSRKVGQGISCEQAGIVVRVLGRSGSVIKLGVDAPKEVSIVRDELPATGFGGRDQEQANRLSTEARHQIDNLLDRVALTAELAESQLMSGMVDEAVETIRHLHDDVNVLRDAGETSELAQSETLQTCS